MDDPSSHRAAIRRGQLRGASLRARLDVLSSSERDAWLDRVLGIDGLPEDGPDLPSGCVPYLPCAVDDILAIVDACPLDARSRVVDLGSGLGRVPILVHLLTGARTHGIEVQSALVRRADEIASSLALPEVTFERLDVRDADLVGDLFVLYAPFSGPILADTMTRLTGLGRRDAITVATIDLTLPPPWIARVTTSSRVHVHTLP